MSATPGRPKQARTLSGGRRNTPRGRQTGAAILLAMLTVTLVATVAAAVWDERQLRLHYDSWKKIATRTVEPLGLVLKAGAWYLVARAAPEGSKAVPAEPRIYRLAAIHTMGKRAGPTA